MTNITTIHQNLSETTWTGERGAYQVSAFGAAIRITTTQAVMLRNIAKMIRRAQDENPGLSSEEAWEALYAAYRTNTEGETRLGSTVVYLTEWDLGQLCHYVALLDRLDREAERFELLAEVA